MVGVGSRGERWDSAPTTSWAGSVPKEHGTGQWWKITAVGTLRVRQAVDQTQARVW